MRPDTPSPARERPSKRRGRQCPRPLAGSLAVLLSAAPAHAAEPSRSGDAALAPHPRRTRPIARRARADAVVACGLAAAATPATYTVQAGDTVCAIAARYGLRTDGRARAQRPRLEVDHLSRARCCGSPRRPRPRLPRRPPSLRPADRRLVTYVAGGDTISAIAAAARHCRSQAVLSANGLGWSSIIYPGQTPRDPRRVVGAAATPQRPRRPAAPPAAPPAADSYVVKAGDTISAIAQQHGVTVQAVLERNGLDRVVDHLPRADASRSRPAAASSPRRDVRRDVHRARRRADRERAHSSSSVGRELGVPDRGIAIALGAAMQESWLRNLD